MAESDKKRILYVTAGVGGVVIDMDIPYRSFSWHAGSGVLHVKLDDGEIYFSPHTLLHVSTVRLGDNVGYLRMLQ